MTKKYCRSLHLDSSLDSLNSDKINHIYPIKFSLEDTQLLRREQDRLKYHLNNVFAGTHKDKPIGDLGLEAVEKKISFISQYQQLKFINVPLL